MMVLHHFAEPVWFAREGGFARPAAIPVYVDFCRKMVRYFGEYVSSWNTFNEPGGYMMMGYFLGIFPPYKKNFLTLLKVLGHMAKAHEVVYDVLKEACPDKPVGISKHTMFYERESAAGWFAEQFTNRFYLGYITDQFHRKADFVHSHQKTAPLRHQGGVGFKTEDHRVEQDHRHHGRLDTMGLHPPRERQTPRGNSGLPFEMSQLIHSHARTR